MELRRQHLLECILSMDKLQRALRVKRPGGAGNDEPVQMAAKEILDALGKADWDSPTRFSAERNASATRPRHGFIDLTPAQRHVYLLRGFGKRLPDMPATTEMDLGNEALHTAVRCTKVRRMLQDYAQELVESGTQVVVEDFLKNLQLSGVVKGGASAGLAGAGRVVSLCRTPASNSSCACQQQAMVFGQ
eukprot:g18835.t1